jgi:hypothetical protein
MRRRSGGTQEKHPAENGGCLTGPQKHHRKKHLVAIVHCAL